MKNITVTFLMLIFLGLSIHALTHISNIVYAQDLQRITPPLFMNWQNRHIGENFVLVI